MIARVATMALAACMAWAGTAGAFEVGARAAYWIPQLSGEVRLDDGTRGDTLDLTDDLGVDDESFFFGDAWLWIGDHHLILSGTRVDYSGTKTLAGVTFGGRTFTGRTDASLEYTQLDLAYRYDLIDLENLLAGFSLGPQIQVKYLDGEVRLETTGVEESQSFQIPIPLAGVGGHLGILADLLEVRAQAVGMGYRGNTIVEASAEVSYNPIPFVELVAGYRYFRIDVEADDLTLDYRQAGPYVGIGAKL